MIQRPSIFSSNQATYRSIVYIHSLDEEVGEQGKQQKQVNTKQVRNGARNQPQNTYNMKTKQSNKIDWTFKCLPCFGCRPYYYVLTAFAGAAIPRFLNSLPRPSKKLHPPPCCGANFAFDRMEGLPPFCQGPSA